MRFIKTLLCAVVLGLGLMPLVAVRAEDEAADKEKGKDKPAEFKPARSPKEALEKFRECVAKRDYKAAAEYLGGSEYRELVLKAAEPAGKLGRAIDELAKAVETVGINSPDGQALLRFLEPFPGKFEFEVTQPVKENIYKALTRLFPAEFPDGQFKELGDKIALAKVAFKISYSADAAANFKVSQMEPKAFLTLVPGGLKWDGMLALKDTGKDKGWKIFFPKLPDLEPRVDYLTGSGKYYVDALKNVRKALMNDAVTKAQFEAELSKQLIDAK
jgi:hypothetical protein